MFDEQTRAKYLAKPVTPKLTLVDRADEVTDIRDILRQMKIWAPTGEFYSYKIDCPWADEHADSGMDKNCRLFGGTNIYCFAMHGRITPTILYSKWKGMSRKAAAEKLLDLKGLLHKKWWETWDELQEEHEQSSHTKLGDKQDLVAALHLALDDDECYTQYEYSPTVRLGWTKVLERMDELWADEDTSFSQLEDFYKKSLHTLQACARLESDNNERKVQ